MTIRDLEAIFQQNDVPRSYYSFRGPGGGDCYALEGPNPWVLFYSERGNRFDLESFATEDAACRRMLERVQAMVESSLHRRMDLEV